MEPGKSIIDVELVELVVEKLFHGMVVEFSVEDKGGIRLLEERKYRCE